MPPMPISLMVPSAFELSYSTWVLLNFALAASMVAGISCEPLELMKVTLPGVTVTL